MRILVIILIFNYLAPNWGQSNEIGFISFKIEKSSETVRINYEPKFTSGVYYNRYFKRLYFTSEFIFAENELEEYCKHCADAITGEGIYKEMSLATGLGIRLHGDKNEGISSKVSLLFYGARTSYAGRFGGGIAPVYYSLDNRYHLLGGQLQYSFTYTFKTRITLGFDLALKRSRLWIRSDSPISTASYIPKTTLTVTAPSIRIGFQF
jgi:hypothetical protein